MSEKEQLLQDLQSSIQEIQKFPWTELSQMDSPHVASKIGCLVNAYQRLTPKALEEMSIKQLGEFSELTKRVQAAISKISQAVRHGYRVDQVTHENVVATFDAVLPVVQEYADRAAATKSMRKEAESLLAEMRDQQEKLTMATQEAETTVAETKASFQQKVDDLEGTVTQLGASLHAAFFKREAEKHEKAAAAWKKGVWATAAVLALYAVASIFFSAIPWLKDVDTVQLAVSKALVFIVLGYALFFCARNYAAERHNAVVNRHRQNALTTYRALVRANKNLEGADIILTQAARFIFAPQDSGYARKGGDGGGDVSVFETVRRAANAVKQGGNE